MTARTDPDPMPRRRVGGDSSSTIRGRSHDVVQARDVSGGIHFHGSGGPRPLPRQLPGDVPGFSHRAGELALLDATAALGDTGTPVAAVCLIDGTAGVGKTALAVHWARRARHLFPDGQLYVSLHGYAPGGGITAGQALGRFLDALGVPASGIPADEDARATLYRSLLADRRVLVVLDDAASADQIRPLLPGSDGCFTLVTSRSRLPGLVARDGVRRITLGLLTETEAVDLLKAATADYRNDDPEPDLVRLARICGRLTLALRVAAERAAAHPQTPLSVLNRDLLGSAAFLGRKTFAEEDRADALRNIFAWSYEALPPEPAEMFRRLSLHPGPDFTVASAAALTGVSQDRAARLIETLADAHLLEQSTRDRWSLHDLLRAYAMELAQERDTVGERDAATRRVCTWYLRMMNEAALMHDSLYGDEWGVTVPRAVGGAGPGSEGVPAAPDVGGFSSHVEALEWFAAETDSLVAVCRAAEQAGLHSVVWRLAALIRTPFLDRHPVDEWLPLGRAALRSAEAEGDGLGRAVAHIGLGVAFRQAQRVTEAIEAERAALEAARSIEDRRQETAALTLLGHAQRRGRRLDQACGTYGEALETARSASLAQWTAWATVGLVAALFDAGRNAEARTALLGLDEAHSARFPGLRAEHLRLLAALECESGDVASAEEHIRAALGIAKATENVVYAGEFGVELGRILIAAGRVGEGLTALEHAAELARRTGDRSLEAGAADTAGEAYRRLGRLAESITAHSRAAEAHLALEDAWRAGNALANLGRAQAEAGSAEAVASYRRAAELIASYRDVRAQALRERLALTLAALDPIA